MDSSVTAVARCVEGVQHTEGAGGDFCTARDNSLMCWFPARKAPSQRNHLRLRSRRRLFHAFRSMAECSLVCSPRVALSRFSTSTWIHVSGARWQDHRALCESGRRRNDAAAWSASTASVAAASVGWLVSSVRKVGHEHTSSVGRSSCRFRLAGAQETQVGSTPRTAAKGETTGCGLKPRRAFDWQQRCRLR